MDRAAAEVDVPRSRAERAAVLAVLVAAAVPRVWLACTDHGIIWPDEVFQSLEQAHRFAFGYGYVSWEFQDGARSWLFPGILGVVFKLAALGGMRSATALVALAKLFMVALSLGGLWCSMRLAERLAGRAAGLLAGALGAFLPVALVYDGRCMTEVASAPPLVGAALLLQDGGRRRLLLAGALAALATYLRYQCGLVALGLFVLLLATRRWRDAGWFALAGTAVVALGSALDWATWGAPFHSLMHYVSFNLLEGGSSQFGTSSAWHYLICTWAATGLAVGLIALGFCAALRRAPGLWLIVMAFALVHSAISHKELRFLLPIIPLTLALAGAGLSGLLGRLSVALGRREAAPAAVPARRAKKAAAPPTPSPAPVRAAPFGLAVVAAVGLAASLSWRATELTFEDLGVPPYPFSPSTPPWHAKEDTNLLLASAGRKPDLCGMALVGLGEIWSGGYTYLHRDVPMVMVPELPAPGQGSSLLQGTANYALAPARAFLPAGFVMLESRGGWRLWRRPGGCSGPPPGYTRLFPK